MAKIQTHELNEFFKRTFWPQQVFRTHPHDKNDSRRLAATFKPSQTSNDKHCKFNDSNLSFTVVQTGNYRQGHENDEVYRCAMEINLFHYWKPSMKKFF